MAGRRREVVIAEKAPPALGPYSAGIRTEKLIFLAGQVGVDPNSGELVPGGIEVETRQALTNLSYVLEAAGSSLDLVVKTTVFLANLDDFTRMNAVYGSFFASEPPARSTIQVAALPKGAQVEIEAIAIIGQARGD